MGREKLGLKPLEITKFNRGYFPNKDFDEVPEGGSSDCKHVIWYKSALRKNFGMDLINSSATGQTRGEGLFYVNLAGVTKRSAVFGTKFYEDVSGTWTDRTGAITITDGAANLVQAINHQQGSNKYAIYVNGTNPPWKWTGSGNAAVLGGSPPANFTSIAKYHDTIFGSSTELVYFSDTGDPETWNSAIWVLRFDKSIISMMDNGQKLAVLMDDHIGSIQGYDYTDFVQEETEIKNIGCVGRLACCRAVFGPEGKRQDVIATVSRNGIYIFDQAFNVRNLVGDQFFNEFNQANLSKAVIAYSNVDNLLFCMLPKDATENDYLLVINMENGALWPCPSIHANSGRAMASMLDDSSDEYIYFSDTSGFVYKFNRTTNNYHTGSATQAIDARFKTRKYDLKHVHKLREAQLLAAADGDWNITMAVGFGLTADDGTSNQINLSDTGAILDATTILDAFVLGGSNYIFKVLSSVGSFGRFLTITFTNSTLSQSFNIKMVNLLIKDRGLRSVDK